MTEEPGTALSFRTKEELRAFVLEQLADAETLAAELRDLSSPMPADTLARVAALQRNWERVAAGAVDLEVQRVTVPDFPPGGPTD